MTAPLAMILVGIAFAELPVKSFFTDPGVYIAGGLRLIVAPFITLALAVAMYYAMPAGFGGADPASVVTIPLVVAAITSVWAML